MCAKTCNALNGGLACMILVLFLNNARLSILIHLYSAPLLINSLCLLCTWVHACTYVFPFINDSPCMHHIIAIIVPKQDRMSMTFQEIA